MNKILTTAIAGYAALCVFGGAAMAGDYEETDRLLEITSLTPHVATCTDSERWCVQGGWTYTSVDYFGLEADASTVDGSVAAKIPGWNNAQVNLSLASGTDKWFDDVSVRVGGRIGFSYPEYVALK